jgi:hypothetical protein
MFLPNVCNCQSVWGHIPVKILKKIFGISCGLWVKGMDDDEK